MKFITTKLLEEYRLCLKFHSKLAKNNLQILSEGSRMTRESAINILSHHTKAGKGVWKCLAKLHMHLSFDSEMHF